MGEWQSGQMHLTVNQATSVYGGSNPSSPTTLQTYQFHDKDENRQAPGTRLFCGLKFIGCEKAAAELVFILCDRAVSGITDKATVLHQRVE